MSAQPEVSVLEFSIFMLPHHNDNVYVTHSLKFESFCYARSSRRLISFKNVLFENCLLVNSEFSILDSSSYSSPIKILNYSHVHVNLFCEVSPSLDRLQSLSISPGSLSLFALWSSDFHFRFVSSCCYLS